MKICRLCLNEQPLDNYYKSSARTRDGLRHECKSCVNKNALIYYQANKEHLVEKRKDYYFLSTYGLTREEIEARKQEQDMKCLCCEEIVELVVDHNHNTGEVRGMLCNPCNQALGSTKENINTLRNMIKYIERYNT